MGKRILLALLALAALFAVAAWVLLNWVLTRPPIYPASIDVGSILLRPWDEHDAIYRKSSFPYVLSFQSATGALEYVGALHTFNAAEPQLTEIEKRWAEFKPTVALCEGRARLSRFASRPKSGKLNESELVRILAQQNGVPLFTLEPPYETEVAGLLQHFEPKLVATYLTLRVYTAEADPSGGNQDGLALSLLRKRTNVDGLRHTLANLAELDAFWKTTFPGAPDWRKLPDTESVPLLGEVGNASRQIRGEHMVRTIAELVGNGERVFAVVGASHVIRQEVALRAWLNPSRSPE